MYYKQFKGALAESFFTHATLTAVAANIIDKMKEVIIDTIKTNGQANWTTIAPIINSILLYS